VKGGRSREKSIDQISGERSSQSQKRTFPIEYKTGENTTGGRKSRVGGQKKVSFWKMRKKRGSLGLNQYRQGSPAPSRRK